MSEFGVQPTGYVRKPLPTTLADIEASLITEFGPGVVQTAASPLGQLNGLMADIITELYELGADIYQSYDPDQAEGTRLETLGKIRLLARGGENDEIFRRSITNEGVARIGLADFLRALIGVPGVTFAKVFVNETSKIDDNGMPPNTIAASVIGGDDLDVGAVVSRYVTPGISTHGNVPIQTDEDGFCRQFQIVRPIEVPIDLSIDVRMRSGDCPAPSPAAVGSALATFLTASATRPPNGQAITPFIIRQFIESTFPQVEFSYFTGTRDGVTSGMNVPILFFEIAKIEEITIDVVR